MKIAHVVIFHKNPGSVERLIKALSHPNFDFYLHLDKKVSIESFAYLSKLPNSYLVSKRIPVRWAGFSQVEAFISAMDDIVNSGVKYDFINLLSGQDYPIKPAEQIYDFFSHQKGKSFMICETPPTPWWDEATSRFTNYHFTDYGFRGKDRLGMILSELLPDREFPLPLTLYGGPYAAYWVLSMEAARYVYDYLKQNGHHSRFFRHTWAADEFLLHTLIMNSSFKDSIVPENYHYIDRSLGEARPKILTVDDLPLLKNSIKFFARKFDPDVDSHILDLIDKELLEE